MRNKCIRLSLVSLMVCAAISGWSFARESAPAAQERALRTRNVILITADGVRHQELFGGADARILSSGDLAGSEQPDRVWEVFWRSDVKARREALMPFLWKELAPNGVVVGNRSAGSSARVTNDQWFSYPGYAEILIGTAQPTIQSNDAVPSPHETILEYVRRALDLRPTQVAAFGSWEAFDSIVAQQPGSIVVNSGYRPILDEIATPEMMRWSELQTRIRTPWDVTRHDAVTLALALEYLKTHRPRLLYLALGETDDWAHERRYDRVLESIHFFDDAIRRVWATVQSMNGYRNRTTLVITTDHGRGRTPEDWIDHGTDVEGSDEIWFAVRGPDTRAQGDLSSKKTYYQNQVAATVLELLGLDPSVFNPSAGEAFDFAFHVDETQ